MKISPSRRLLCAAMFVHRTAVLSVLFAAFAPALWAAEAPIVLTGADRRPATSLDGRWASIVDP